MDIKTTFLHGNIEETIYIEQSQGILKDKSKVCMLKNYLYVLKASQGNSMLI